MLRSIAVVVLLTPIALPQVQVTTGRTHLRSHEVINVRVTNLSKAVVSYCVEAGQVSFKTGSGDPEDIEPTPIPFYVQQQANGRWSTLLIGPDVGSSRHADVLKPGDTQTFPFRLSDRGRMRVVLEYWLGENSTVCNSPKRKKTAKSNIFVVN